ncbi:facilitated trehalose transporter Tret1-like [Bombus vosnesenskii]|uniref:Facilitated trehalose transporter Tret1-like n=2 Tax=Pyrobombus TaxID=144703 RepID=A0A6J3KI66_9HYME|nr:facilitated trehalose transporter Tret1-like [Bombus bifarius]XP_033352823.1 facilitated trehalose transporter Tret1-like [Bombus vosnesenskii]XP_050477441.1 facilitated trehalose transporter Tret1-like [Bombus huntii]
MKKVYLAVFASNLGMISFGLFFGWSSPSLSLLLQDDSPIPLTVQQAAWVSSIYTLASAVGSVLCSYVVNVIGRKTTLAFAAIPGVIGWMMIALATSAWELIAGRFVCGLSNGFGYICATMYIGEISPANIRGTLTSTLTVAAKFGLFVEWAIGPFLSIRNLALASSLIPILFFVSLISLPESPYHLMRRGRNQEAVTCLMQLRGATDVSKEMEMIEKSIKYDLSNNTGLWELVSVSGNRKALIVVLGLFVIQQWSGSLAILSYAELIFNATKNQLQGKYLTMILGGVQVMCAVMSASIVDRYSRRTLLLISTSGVTISTYLIGLFFCLQYIEMDISEITWLPAAGSILYIVTYAFGLAALPFTMMSEVFPTNVKALGSTIGMLCCNCCAFAVTLSYQSIVEQNGIYVAFWLFSSITALGTIFIYYCVPETKRKTLQEIQEQLHGYKL